MKTTRVAFGIEDGNRWAFDLAEEYVGEDEVVLSAEEVESYWTHGRESGLSFGEFVVEIVHAPRDEAFAYLAETVGFGYFPAVSR